MQPARHPHLVGYEPSLQRQLVHRKRTVLTALPTNTGSTSTTIDAAGLRCSRRRPPARFRSKWIAGASCMLGCSLLRPPACGGLQVAAQRRRV